MLPARRLIVGGRARCLRLRRSFFEGEPTNTCAIAAVLGRWRREGRASGVRSLRVGVRRMRAALWAEDLIRPPSPRLRRATPPATSLGVCWNGDVLNGFPMNLGGTAKEEKWRLSELVELLIGAGGLQRVDGPGYGPGTWVTVRVGGCPGKLRHLWNRSSGL